MLHVLTAESLSQHTLLGALTNRCHKHPFLVATNNTGVHPSVSTGEPGFVDPKIYNWTWLSVSYCVVNQCCRPAFRKHLSILIQPPQRCESIKGGAGASQSVSQNRTTLWSPIRCKPSEFNSISLCSSDGEWQSTSCGCNARAGNNVLNGIREVGRKQGALIGKKCTEFELVSRMSMHLHSVHQYSDYRSADGAGTTNIIHSLAEW